MFCGYFAHSFKDRGVSGRNIETTNVSQNLLVTERMKGKPHQENLLCLAMLSLLRTDEMIL